MLDLGASKTVVGSEHVGTLIRSLEDGVRSQVSRCACRITFRFGNEATLTSSQALVIPIGNLRLKIAIVPGGTPFLISNTLMRAIHAQVDCHKKTLSSPKLSRDIPLELTPKGLFLLDLNELVKASGSVQAPVPQSTKLVEETFMACENVAAERKPGHVMEPVPEISPNLSEISDLPKPHECMPPHNCQKAEPKPHELMTNETNPRLNVTEPTPCSEPSAQSPVLSSQLPSVSPVKDHVVAQPPSSLAAGRPNAVDQLGQLDTGRSDERESPVRTKASGPYALGGMGGPAMDHIHDQPLQQEQSSSSPSVAPICGVDDRAPREGQVVIPVRPPQESVAGYAGTSGRSGSVFPQSKMKARPSNTTPAISLDDGTEEEFEMYASTTMNQPITENPEFKAIQDRMLNLENALTRVIHHLESKIEEVPQ